MENGCPYFFGAAALFDNGRSRKERLFTVLLKVRGK